MKRSKVFGPYRRKADGRWFVAIHRDDGSMTTKSYPKVLMEKHLGRKLRDDEDVHHKDDDMNNNVLSNLEIITKPAHMASCTLL